MPEQSDYVYGKDVAIELNKPSLGDGNHETSGRIRRRGQWLMEILRNFAEETRQEMLSARENPPKP